MKTIAKILFSFVFFSNSFCQEISFAEFSAIQNVRIKSNAAFNLAEYYFMQRGDSVDVVVAELLKHESDEVYSEVVKAVVLFIRGKQAIINLGDLSLARKKMFAARNYFFSQQDFERVVQSNMNIGNSYYNEGEFQNAIKYYHKALNLAVEFRNYAEYIEPLFAIGRSYVELGDTLKGLDFIDRYAQVVSENNFPTSYSKALAYEAMIHFDSGDTEKARLMYKKSAEVGLQSDLKEIYADGLTNQAIYFYLTNEMDSARWYFENALSVRKEIGAIKQIIESNFNLGSFYFGQERFEKAVEFFLESKNMSKEKGFWIDEKDVNEELLKLNEKFPISTKLLNEVKNDQKRLEKQVDSQSEIHLDLDRQMEYWLESGLSERMQKVTIESKSNWTAYVVLGMVFLMAVFILKVNWN